MLAAFQDGTKGLEHAMQVPDVPYPEVLPRSATTSSASRRRSRRSSTRSSRSTCATPTTRRGS